MNLPKTDAERIAALERLQHHILDLEIWQRDTSAAIAAGFDKLVEIKTRLAVKRLDLAELVAHCVSDADDHEQSALLDAASELYRIHEPSALEAEAW